MEYALFRRHAVHTRKGELIIRSERDGHAHVVQLIGELDMDTARAFEDELRRVESSDALEIIVDLRGLRSIGADGLKAFIHAGARSRRGGNRLTLVRGSERVQKTFETTGLLSRLPFADDRDVPSLLHSHLSRSHAVA
jgi:anti-anti-sigma factor